ncbi:MAG: hypothetical protein R2865_05830 [Deinococcales bacterium]
MGCEEVDVFPKALIGENKALLTPPPQVAEPPPQAADPPPQAAEPLDHELKPSAQTDDPAAIDTEALKALLLDSVAVLVVAIAWAELLAMMAKPVSGCQEIILASYENKYIFILGINLDTGDIAKVFARMLRWGKVWSSEPQPPSTRFK